MAEGSTEIERKRGTIEIRTEKGGFAMNLLAAMCAGGQLRAARSDDTGYQRYELMSPAEMVARAIDLAQVMDAQLVEQGLLRRVEPGDPDYEEHYRESARRAEAALLAAAAGR